MYTITNNTYIAEDGYIFRHKDNGAECTMLILGQGDSIDNWEYIENPVEDTEGGEEEWTTLKNSSAI